MSLFTCRTWYPRSSNLPLHDTLLRIGLWVQSTFMDEALEASTRLLTADTLQVGPLGKKRLQVGKISFDDNRVTVTGDLTDAPKTSANPRKRR